MPETTGGMGEKALLSLKYNDVDFSVCTEDECDSKNWKATLQLLYHLSSTICPYCVCGGWGCRVVEVGTREGRQCSREEGTVTHRTRANSECIPRRRND